MSSRIQEASLRELVAMLTEISMSSTAALKELQSRMPSGEEIVPLLIEMFPSDAGELQDRFIRYITWYRDTPQAAAFLLDVGEANVQAALSRENGRRQEFLRVWEQLKALRDGGEKELPE